MATPKTLCDYANYPPRRITVISSNLGRCPGSSQPRGERIRATLIMAGLHPFILASYSCHIIDVSSVTSMTDRDGGM